ncbi:MAG: hypothetical protein A6F71_09460 [Cycloclasticus sp. symbiont of Poecilosclerida sp. M]|nr:MAG: hypothetical protein A6F71_09460 [Cycloclasticus sp. symbiont of Poecilosclerida sp. M]
MFNSFVNRDFGIVVNSWIGASGLFGLILMLYPIGGLIADLRYGRYRVIKMSLVHNLVVAIILSVLGVLFSTKVYRNSHYALGVAMAITVSLSMILFVLGIGGFQANIVQFCLDQLLDASSEELSLFLHWFVWTEQIGELFPRLITAASFCHSLHIDNVIGYSGLLYLALSTGCLILVCRKHRWNCENVVGNPYRNVYRVLKFAAKHGKPLGHRSALTYSDDVKPPRIDFAKQKYGGIFTTEVVEDVKTFLRILLMLLAITPVFYFEVSTSYLFPIYGLHLGKNVSVNEKCTYEWMLFESGTLSTIISVIVIPLYIVLVYPHIKRWVPRIIYRMGIGMALRVMSVITMFIIQVVANYTASHEYSCLFLAEYRNNKHYHFSQTLEFPTQVLVIISFLNGIASPLINITVLEFISAQSPHTMKGLLLGVFYAFRGLFITLGCVATFPFTQEKLWGDHRGIFDCGFYYYLSNSVLGVIGLVVFLMAARWYRNRERDDPPYKHQYAEDYYSHYASRPTTRLVEEEVESYGSIN